MRGVSSILAALALAATVAFPSAGLAASKHNGGCQGFAGSTAGQNYAGIKCYLDSAPGDWVIRHTVMERNNATEYKQLLKVPRRQFRCTLTKVRELPGNGVLNITYDIEKCG